MGTIKYFTFISCLCFVLLIFACKKDKNDSDKDNQIPLSFVSLIAESDTIYSGLSTNVTATATGYNLTYLWSASSGDILGSGSSVQYAAPPCVSGVNIISCTVKDGYNNSKNKTVTIVSL